MERTIDYRGPDIHIGTKPSMKSKFDARFRIDIVSKFEGIAQRTVPDR
ncbi:hypothetical protein [Burkholderia oklahomensis]|uniref:Uncharacterized protein n=1 Tax=Burkholderia oklahomensis TaxID=342113 RepID=A0AAI8FRD5_9BURK|nr:hypothetical protein [Burkholderia oklahomensis]AIO70129.1 hypothetical protein DM82_5682 [Burkholderia oklahomensis]AJX34240.1 hypothetical protein BG90_4950 [Burkholderia oklahomensis C6786]MBI0363162.1 hypothetical protein [Burkholderia oklahomensis]QPS40703.1 hypothetical protein I6G57_20495 [Burkholderia oklahomensis]SUY27275.1 Uncharacterised protein [Burkholderia oklahomensis]